MKTLGKLVLVLMGLVLLLALAAAVAGGWALLHGGLPVSTALLEINGESVDLARLGGGGVLLATAGVVLALCAVAVVVPATLVFAFAVAGLAVTLAFGSVLGVVLLLLSPLLLPLGLVWWLRRRSRRAPATQPGAAQ